jgi:hypothetical protein
MEIDTGDRCIVRLVDFSRIDAGFLACSVEAINNVNSTFFCSDPEGTGLVVGKVETRHGNLACFAVVSLMREVKRFLSRKAAF